MEVEGDDDDRLYISRYSPLSGRLTALACDST